MVGTALWMAVIYLVFAIAFRVRAGVEAYAALEASSIGDYLVLSVENALFFGVGVALILFGVRTILGEVVPAFAGIAERVVPARCPRWTAR